MQTCPISTTTNFEIHLIKNCNPVCPLSFQTHVAILFSGIQTCLISTTRDLEIQILLKSGVPNFHQNRLANSIFSTMWTCPSSCQPDFEIHRFLQSGVPNFNSNRFGNSFFWYPDIPHFHPSDVQILCSEIWTWPHSTPTHLEIQFFLQSGVTTFLENRL